MSCKNIHMHDTYQTYIQHNTKLYFSWFQEDTTCGQEYKTKQLLIDHFKELTVHRFIHFKSLELMLQNPPDTGRQLYMWQSNHCRFLSKDFFG